jgi:hypothetical protein
MLTVRKRFPKGNGTKDPVSAGGLSHRITRGTAAPGLYRMNTRGKCQGFSQRENLHGFAACRECRRDQLATDERFNTPKLESNLNVG